MQFFWKGQRMLLSFFVKNLTNFTAINPKLATSIILDTEVSRQMVLYKTRTDEQFVNYNRAKVCLIQNYTEHHLPLIVQVAPEDFPEPQSHH